MGFSNNSPGLSYVSWNNISIMHNGQSYIIQNSYTCMKYIYWNHIDPYKFQTSNKLLDEIGNRWLIAVNDFGIVNEITQTEITINKSEGTNKDLIDIKIEGVIEQTEEFGQRFSTMETDINGIKQTVGQVNELSERVTSFEQTVDDLTLKANNIEKEFIDEKNANILRENINKSLVEFNSTVGEYFTNMKKYIEDNKITSSEQSEINLFKSTLSTKRLAVNSYVDEVLSVLDIKGDTTNHNILNSEKTKFNNSIDVLNNIIETVITDSLITPSEITNIISSFGAVNTRANILKNTIDDMFFLGVGGSITEELAKIGIKSDNITLSVEKIKTDLKNNLNLAKSHLQGQIDDVNTSLVSLKSYFDKIIEDREVTSSESVIFDDKINEFNTEVEDVLIKYQEIINDENLSDSIKNNIISAYSDLISIKTNMINTINLAIKDSIINDIEINDCTYSIESMSSEISRFHSFLCQGLDDIELNRFNKELTDAKNELSKEIEDLSKEVNNMVLDSNEAMNSGLIDEIEKKNMLNILDLLEKDKLTVDTRFNSWYNDLFLYGNDKINYKTTYDAFIKSYNELSNLINKIANSIKLVSDTDKQNVSEKMKIFNDKLSDFYYQSDKIITIISNNESEYHKNNIYQEIKDSNNAINSVIDEMNNSFKDSVITKSEIISINNMFTILEKEVNDIRKRFNEIYNNPNLD